MNKTIGYILNMYAENTDLNPFLSRRSISTLPFGGRYRLIDFTLSNLVNAGVGHVGVVGSYKYNSLVDHLGAGKEWSLSRKTQDLSILAGSGAVRFNELVKISTRDLSNNRAFIDRFDVEHVIIVAPNLVTSFDFRQAFDLHIEEAADITLIYKDVEPTHRFIDNDVFLEMKGKKIVGLSYKSQQPSDHAYAEMLIIRKDILIKLLDLADRVGEWDLMDIIMNNVDTLNIAAAPHTGYLRNIYDLKSYYDVSMDLLKEDTIKALFLEDFPIYTKIKDNHPTQYDGDAVISSSIIGSGCHIKGKISESILFRDSKISENTKISHSILMQKANIGKNVTLDYVICDKDVHIRDNTTLMGTCDQPIIIPKGSRI